MSLKKNAVSYCIWMIMLLFAGAGVAFLGLVVAQMLVGNSILLAVGMVAGFFAILYAIYLLAGYFVRQVDLAGYAEKHSQIAMFAEGLFIGLSISAAIAVRMYLMPYASQDALYFEAAKVTSQSGISIQSVQGSVYYYCMLLHGLLRLFGNHWEVGVWLQIWLQTIFSLLIYFSIRRMTSKWPAIWVMLFISFAPVSIDAGLTYSPQMLFLCFWALGFLLLADYLCRSISDAHPIGMWFYTVFVGIMIGFVSYVDVTGILLLLPVFCIGMISGTVGKAVLSFLRIVVIFLVALGNFAGMIGLDAVLSGSTFVRVLNAWFVTYGTVELNIKILTEEIQMELLLLLILVFIGVFSFWRRKKEEVFTPYVLLVVGMCALYFAGVTVGNMDGSYLLYVLLAALAGIAVSELFHRSRKKHVEPVVEAKEEKVEIIDLEKREQQPKEENKMIENPLPVPKKRERKVMDYAFIPKPSEMMYDIKVSDKDDFDI